MTVQEQNDLLEKYLLGTCTPDEEAQVLAWAKQLPKEPVFPLKDAEKTKLERRLWRRIRASTQSAQRLAVVRRPWIWAVAAASVALVLMAVNLFHTRPLSLHPNEVAMRAPSDVEFKNTSSVVQKLTLEDGSAVWLQPQAKLSYPAHFEPNRRRVYLSGEARFDVKRDTKRPFTVQTGDLTTEVLGTSFVIRSHERSPSIEVAVLSGKVSVYENGSPQATTRIGAVLTPNQRVTFFKASKQLIPSVVEKPVVISTPTQKPVDFTFEDTPLLDVLTKLSESYALEILIDNEQLKQCVFTADLNGLTLFSQLEMVCRSVNARYEVRGTHIFVSGEGCQ
jgi:transmembrane sensor